MHKWHSRAMPVLLVVYMAMSDLSAQPQATNEEYAVYSALIGQKYVKDKVRVAVIRDQTLVDTGDSVRIAGNFRRLMQQLSPMEATLDDYKENNKTSHRLDRKFDLAVPYVLLTERENNEIFRKGWDGWKRFYDKYQGSFGEVSVSALGFNRERNQALVYVGHACGSLCASGQYVLLVKTEGAWKIDKDLLMWIS